MEHITIPIPDGIDATQKAEMTRWLAKQAAAMTPDRFPIEDDQAWHDELAADIRQAMDQINTGRGLSSSQARQQSFNHLQLAAKTQHGGPSE